MFRFDQNMASLTSTIYNVHTNEGILVDVFVLYDK